MPPPPLNPVDRYLRSIEREFGLTPTTARLATAGRSYRVLIVDEQLAFRFPRNEQKRRHLGREIQLLEYLQRRLSLPVPNYLHVAADRSFGGYPLIRGDPLTPWIFRSAIDESARESMAADLGVFLQHLHATPVSVAASFGVAYRSPRRSVDQVLAGCAELVYPNLSEREIRELELLILTFCQAAALPHRRVLLHGSFSPQHILVDRERQTVAGVIDFGSRAIADPARDFAASFEYGPTVVQRALAAYGAGDELLLFRAFQYFRWRKLIGLLMDARARGGGWDERAYERFRRATSGVPGTVRKVSPPLPAWRRLDRSTAGDRVRRMIEDDLLPAIPHGSLVVVIDKGKRLAPGTGWRLLPFPEQNGGWGGYPADDTAAIAELERLRKLGASFVLVPAEMRYWLDAYPRLAARLRDDATIRVDNERVLLFEL